MGNKTYRFKAVLEKHPTQNATYILFPYDVEEEFGAKRVRIKASIDGADYRGSLVNMGLGYMVAVSRKIREMIDKGPGEVVEVVLTRDMEERKIEIPGDLSEALRRLPDESAFFDTLSYTNRKEYVRWITGAKREETRRNRLQKTIEKLKMKKKNPSEK
jgi:hypothetical protein